MIRKLNVDNINKINKAACDNTLEKVTIYKAINGKNKGRHMIDYKIGSDSPIDIRTQANLVRAIRRVSEHVANKDFKDIDLHYVKSRKFLTFRVIEKNS